MSRLLIIASAVLISLSASRAELVFQTTNNINDLNPVTLWVTNLAEDIRFTLTSTDGSKRRDLSGSTGLYLVVSYRAGGWTNAAIQASSFNTNGVSRYLIPQLYAGEYQFAVTDYRATSTTLLYNAYWTLTNAPASAASVVVNNVYITNATYVTGGLISNVLTGVSNHWDASTGTLHVNDEGCQSYTIGTTGQAYNTVWNIDDCTILIGTNAATTLGGYTPQQIADLERSSANFDFTVLTWAPTVTIARADGVFQYLTTEGPTWIRVPAGLTNMGYMVNLDIAGTTNPITFLPDHILIATNLYTYTNRTMTFLIHNPWPEETVGVYGLKRDND